MAGACYSYEDSEKGWRINFEFEGTLKPYTPATYEHPSDGGVLENLTIDVTEFVLEVNGKACTIPLTNALKEELAKVVQNAHDNNTDMQDEMFSLAEEARDYDNV